MSGGSYDYVSMRIDEAVEELKRKHADQPHVIALAEHLFAISSAMHDIEWADSGDTSWDAALDAKIRALLAPGAELDVAAEQARKAADILNAALARVRS